MTTFLVIGQICHALTPLIALLWVVRLSKRVENLSSSGREHRLSELERALKLQQQFNVAIERDVTRLEDRLNNAQVMGVYR